MTKIIFLVIFIMEKKEKLLFESAKKLFWKYWPKKTSIDEIVKNAWVAKGTFYLYFKNKEDIYKKIIDIDFLYSKKIMTQLYKNFPDIKERLVNYLVWSIYYFKKNEIIRNMVLWNSNYYIWEINISYLEKSHIKLLHILLEDFEKSYKEDDISSRLKFLSQLMWNFKQNLLIEDKCFSSEKEFNDFILNHARVLISWFFSDYKNIWKYFDVKFIEKNI